eukprot:GFYU01074711.1.p1 GENE.GFYU01074711.1~~GFYU01074711.1.p1  ORF type:complete len:104 (+),score=2.65 GFYU01074711.1:58-369(+)
MPWEHRARSAITNHLQWWKLSSDVDGEGDHQQTERGNVLTCLFRSKARMNYGVRESVILYLQHNTCELHTVVALVFKLNMVVTQLGSPSIQYSPPRRVGLQCH